MRPLNRLLVTLALLAATACAPRVMPPGKAVTPPEMADDHLRMPDGAILPLRVWRPAGPPRAMALALHGFNDYSNAFDAPARYLAEHGVLTYAYDQRGFGDSPNRGIWPGVQGLTDDLRTAHRLVRARHPDLPMLLLGESMGGAVIMTALAQDAPPQADGIVLAAPAVWTRAVMPAWQRTGLSIAAHLIPAMQFTGSGFGKVPSDNTEMLRALSRDKKVIKWTRVDSVYGLVNLMDAAYAAAPALRGNVLILFGSKEDILPGAALTAFARRLPRDRCRLRLAQYDTGFHMLLRDLQAERVLRDVASWIADMRAPLPSGTELVLAPGDDGHPENGHLAQQGDGARRTLALECGPSDTKPRARSSAG